MTVQGIETRNLMVGSQTHLPLGQSGRMAKPNKNGHETWYVE